MHNYLWSFKKSGDQKILSHQIWPWIVLGCGLFLTYVAWKNVQNTTQKSLQAEFTFRTQEVQARIKERLKGYEQVLLGTAGLFKASKSIERDEFRNYVAALQIGKNYPGIQGIGFSLRIPAPELSRHIESIRQEGFPNYTIRPAGERDPYTSIIYLEPFTDRNLRAFGYDMYSESVRHAAMDESWNTGHTTISGKVILVQETNKNIQAGFLMYVPVYRNNFPHETLADRRENLLGWAYSPFRMNDFMQGILWQYYGSVAQFMDLEIYDGDLLTPDTLMFDSQSEHSSLTAIAKDSVIFTETQILNIEGHHWSLIFRSLPGFWFAQNKDRSQFTAIFGLGATLALTIIVWLLVNGRVRALRMAEKLTNELSESENRYHQAFEVNTAIKLIVDKESGRIIDANQAAVKYYGYDWNQLLMLNIADINCLSVEEIQREMEIAVSENRLYFQFRHRLASGVIRDVEVYSGPILLHGRMCLHSIINDITERKLIEESHRRLSIALEQSPISVVITDMNANIQWVNKKFTEITGYTSDEIMGQNPRILQSGKQTIEFYRQFWNTLIAGNTWEGQMQNRRKNGELYWEYTSISPVRNDHGVITHYVGVKQDITERKRVEEAMQQNNERISKLLEEQQAILQSEVVGIVMLRNRIMCWMNKAYAQMLGYQSEELINQSTYIFYPSEKDYHVFENNTYPIINAGQVFRTQIQYRRKDGSLGWFDVSGTQLHPGSEESVWAFVDISTQKHTELALIEAQQIAERAVRHKSEFLANMSHEIRTPMNGIIGLAELALYQPLSPGIRNYLEKIHISAKSLLGILNDILDYSKIDAGRMTIEHAPFDLNALLDTLHSLFTLRAEEKSLHFAIKTATEVPRQLIGDPLRVQQILSNLLGNAIKFTARGHVILRITAEVQDRSQVYLIFRVEDTGIGMSEATIASLFQPFTQADGSISRRFGGTGLGLAISHELLLLMGSDFSVTSVVGQGSIFTFKLLFRITAGIPSDTRDSLLLKEIINQRGRSLMGARILVVEDNIINQEIIYEFLKRWGIVVEIANHGQEALDYLSQRYFDAVLMDVHMPVMDGLEATRQIRQRKELPSLPIIALTAGVTKEEQEIVLNSGMNDFIGKPINQGELVQTLLKWIPQRMEQRSSAKAISASSQKNIETPLEIRGFDLKNLRSIFEERPKLLEILRKFSVSIQEDMNKIDQAVATNQIKQAQGLAHRIKGAAGNMGAVIVYGAATQLDAELRQGYYTIPKLEALRQACNQAITEIGSFAG